MSTLDGTYTKEEIAPGEFHVQRVIREVYAKRTAHQAIEVVETESYGRGLFLDGRIQHVAADEYVYSEAMVHPAVFFLQERCRRVLCLGGGPAGVVREVLKYPFVEKVVQVEIESEMIQLARQYFGHISRGCFEDPRYELVIDDGARYLRRGEESFDLIVNDLSEPLPESPAVKFFTPTILGTVRERLHPEHGIYVSWAGSANPLAMDFSVLVLQGVAKVFPCSAAYLFHAQTYGTSWLTALGSMGRLAPLAAGSEEIDRFLADCCSEELRFYDGETHHAMFRLPKNVRTEIARRAGSADDWLLRRQAGGLHLTRAGDGAADAAERGAAG
jgi:spermidine synthase